MKKLFTLCIAFIVSLAVTAQSADGLEFVDSEGNVISSGSTVVRYAAPSLIGVVANSGISIKNTSSASKTCTVVCSVENMPSGYFQYCGSGGCVAMPVNYRIAKYPYSETRAMEPVTLESGKTRSTSSEWYPAKEGEYGSFNTIYSIDGGSEITVNFVYTESSSIAGVQAAEESEVTGYYTIGGQRLDRPQKGITIVRYSDGTSEKILR